MEDDASLGELEEKINLLTLKEDSLKELDREIEIGVEDDALEEEIACSENYKEKINVARTKVQLMLRELSCTNAASGLCIRHAVLPLEDPIIRGLRSQYQIGDPVNLTCSYGPSKPNASLTWYINDRKVPTGSEEVVENGHFVDAETLWHAHSRVSFVAQASHFWHGTMEVRCASHSALPYFVSSEELTIRDYGRIVDVSGPRINGPRLEGARDYYSLGNVIDLSCRADATSHELKWHMNDREAPDSYVSTTSNGHGAATLRLNFRLAEQHFNKGELRLKCVSRQLREFTAASELRVPVSDKRHSSGLQVYFARANGSIQNEDFRWVALLFLVVLVAST
ncbi:hypothetical protein HPB51_028859 [Rhipicephalus microplus]|uniref:Ig-like domain-containing protein n=1 Tax=Rhipicephalus microplus TaxID=6941 RepID=A0A9J6CVR7_RHIMP|nr:hypothetical protein HPB51_028859 [Rhipicephalus microplus]